MIAATRVPESFGNPWMKNLQEIQLPEPVSWTPRTVGWYGLAVLVLIALGWLALRAYRRWQADAYRRAALAELREIERNRSLGALPALLKRVALAAYPRPEVAGLSGEAWLGFLDGAVGSTEFLRGPGRRLPELSYDPAASARVTEADTRALLALSRRWIVRHRAPRG